MNGTLLIDNWADQAPTDKTGTITLVANQQYDLKVDYYENGGGAVAKLQWQSPSQVKEIVPTTQLYPAVVATVPATPTGLAATAASASQITLAWTDAATNETAYQVERATASAGPWTVLTTTLAANSTAYSATGLTAATAYWFRVRAANATGNSAYSNTATATTQAAPVADVTIAQTSTAPVIDGRVDAVWSTASPAQAISKTSGTISSTSDCSATWQTLWDATNLYLLVTVTDDVKKNDSTNAWDDDSIEVYLDGGKERTTAYDANDRQYAFGWNDTAVVEAGGRNATGVVFAKTDINATSYRIEIKIPWTALGVTPTAGNGIGIDVHVNDDDDGGARDGKLMWKDGTDMAWSNPNLFGIGLLAPSGVGANPIRQSPLFQPEAGEAIVGRTYEMVQAKRILLSERQ